MRRAGGLTLGPALLGVRPVLAVLAVLALLGAGTSGCSVFSEDEAPPEEADASAPAAAPPDVVSALQSALDARADAVQRRDRDGFMSGVATGDRGFRRQQAAYFANLVELPIGMFRYSFDPADLVRDGDDYWVAVDLRMQLRGYDDRPAVTRDRYRFTPAGAAGFALASVSDLQWEVEHRVVEQPWESGRVAVREVPGVLGIFDRESRAAAGVLLKSVQQGIVYVSAVVPYEWSRTVVVYALSDPAFLASIPDLPGSDPQTLDAVAFPVPANPETERLAATRIVLHPRMLDRAGPARDRLIRHELTHVALGPRDDHAPIWLSEGLAEYVSVRPMPPEQRDVADEAVAAARDGFVDLPPDSSFNDSESAVNYAQGWWACEYLASSFDTLTLWSLLDQMGRADADHAAVLRTYTGLNTRMLARKAGKLLLATYDPSALDHPPADPSASPTSTATAEPTPTPEPTPAPSG